MRTPTLLKMRNIELRVKIYFSISFTKKEYVSNYYH